MEKELDFYSLFLLNVQYIYNTVSFCEISTNMTETWFINAHCYIMPPHIKKPYC